MTRRRRVLIVVSAIACALAHAASAQQYPVRLVRIIVPAAPVGSMDVMARVVGQRLSEAWGQPVIIDNRPGAGGTTGAEVVAKARPDGYTLLIGSIATIVPGYEALNFHGMHAPRNTPRALVQKLNADTTKVLVSREVKDKLQALAMDVPASSPERYRSFIKSEIDKWAPLIKASGARVE